MNFRKLIMLFTSGLESAFVRSEQEVKDMPDYLAGIVYDDRVECNGIFYTNNLVVTAASCIKHYWRDYSVIDNIYFSDQSKISIDNIEFHPSYSENIVYDCNLVKLKLIISPYMKKPRLKIRLVYLDEAQMSSYPHHKVSIVGWRQSSPAIPKSSFPYRLNVETVDSDQCKRTLKYFNASSQFCAGADSTGQGACHFLPGAPILSNIFMKPNILGLFSWTRPCMLRDLPVVSEKFSEVKNWIKQKFQNQSEPLSDHPEFLAFK